jgi:hypothetical protein
LISSGIRIAPTVSPVDAFTRLVTKPGTEAERTLVFQLLASIAFTASAGVVAVSAIVDSAEMLTCVQ